MQTSKAEFGEDFIGDVASLSETPPQLDQHALFLHNVVLSILQLPVECLGRDRLFTVKSERLEIVRQTLLLTRPGQIALEEVHHVVLGEAVTFYLLVRSIDLLDHRVGDIAREHVPKFKFTLALILAPALLISRLLALFILQFLHLDLFYHRRSLLLKFLLHVDIVFIFFTELLVDNLLELIAALLSDQMHIKVPVDELVPLEAFDNLCWVLIRPV